MLYNHFTEAAFYIYFLVRNKTKNKQLPISKLLALNFSFYLFTPTIDKEPIIFARTLAKRISPDEVGYHCTAITLAVRRI